MPRAERAAGFPKQERDGQEQEGRQEIGGPERIAAQDADDGGAADGVCAYVSANSPSSIISRDAISSTE